jgi:hypothetical protein
VAADQTFVELVADALPGLQRLEEEIHGDQELADLAGSLLEPLSDLLDSLGKTLAEIEGPIKEWSAFLKEHPELRGRFIEAGVWPDGTPRSAHYSYDPHDPPDEAIIAALAKFSDHPEGVTSQEVLAGLFGSVDEACVPHDRDCMNYDLASVPQQGTRLWALTLRGLVERTRKRQGSRPALWRLTTG